MRFSGDMNTSLGNCLLMCAMVWVWVHRQGIRARLANNGDDCVVIMERKDHVRFNEGLREYFRGLGFTMKVEPAVDVLEKVEFCQSHPVFDGSKWVMVRNHRSAMAKDCVSLHSLTTPAVYNKWRSSVSKCGLSLTGGIPCQQAFYQAMGRGAGDVGLDQDPTIENMGMRLMANGMVRKTREPTPESRLSYWLAFGVTPDQQEALESHYSTIEPRWVSPDRQGVPPDHPEYRI